MEFLKSPHRHIFYITAKKEVTHLDRDIEIIQLKRVINSYLKKMYAKPNESVLYFGSKSCEMIAMELLNQFDLCYCSVLEDGENGAEVIKSIII